MKSYMSASGIKTFETCPKQWWFRYVSDLDPVIEEPKYLNLGNAVHYTIEDVLQQDPPPDWDSWESWGIEERFRDIYEVRYAHLVTEDLEDAAYTCLATAARALVKESPRLIDVEAEVEFNVDRPDVSGRFLAKMDVCTDREIWDWKTGSIRDDTPLKEKLQGAVYMAAYRAEYGRPPEKIRFLYLKEETARTLDPTDDVWNTLMRHASQLELAKKNDDFPAKPGDQCYWCDFEQYCTAAGGIGANFDWEKWMAL